LTGVGPDDVVDEVSHPATMAAAAKSTAATNERVVARTRSATGSSVGTAEWLWSKRYSIGRRSQAQRREC
jgi:hypothetical protein